MAATGEFIPQYAPDAVMQRRQLLGFAGGLAAGGLAGCLGSGSNATPTASPQRTFVPVSGGPRTGDDLPTDETPLDGFPPAFDPRPPERHVNPDRFGTMTVDPQSFSGNDGDGVVVPLIPIDAAFYWYWNQEARFADARAPGGYEQSHILGAVSSPAPAGGEGEDPVADWPRDDHIVLYCGCPHHLSGLRAATLIQEGYEHVYAIDEGFWEWQDRNYPLAGEDVDQRPALRVIDGLADPRHAGRTAWAFHRPTDQVEAGPIGPEGRYRLRLRFADVSPGSVVTVETPGYTVSAPLRELMAGLVTA